MWAPLFLLPTVLTRCVCVSKTPMKQQLSLLQTYSSDGGCLINFLFKLFLQRITLKIYTQDPIMGKEEVKLKFALHH